MKRIAATLLLVFAAAFTASAAGVAVKGVTVGFTDPAGYVNLDGGKYTYVAAQYRSNLDKEYKASHLYYSEEDIKAMDAGADGPGKFIAVMAYTDWLFQTYFLDYKTELRTLYDPSKEHTDLRVEKSLGIFNETPTDVSVLLLRKNAEEDEEYDQVYVVTHMLRERRLILVAQYEKYTDMERVGAFKAEAVARLKAMNFPGPGEDAFSKTITAIAAVALLLVAGGLGYGFYRFRPKSK